SSRSRTEEFNIVLSKIKLPPSSGLVEMNAESNSYIDFNSVKLSSNILYYKIFSRTKIKRK
ncbi:hypothetical protein ACFLSS_00330, partial [Bacteroidota bacterium]